MKISSTSNTFPKRLACTILLILVLFSLISSMLPTASADKLGGGKSYNEYLSNLKSAAGDGAPLAEFTFNVVCMAYGCHPDLNFAALAGNIFKFSQFKGNFTTNHKIIELLNGESPSLISAAKAMYGIFEVVGIALIMLFFLIEIMDEVQADNFNVEHLVKKLITLTIAIIVMKQGPTILQYISEFGDALIDDAAEASIAGDKNLYMAYSQIYDGAKFGAAAGLFSLIRILFALIGIMMQNIFTFLLMLVALLIAYLTAYSRFIEFLIRFAFAPIGIAQLVSGGSKGPGMRYIKKFASVVIQGAICTLAFGTVAIIQQNSGAISGMFGQFIVPITLIGFLFKVKQIADDVVGV